MNLLSLKGIHAILFDLDGTLYDDDEPIPGAAKTVIRLRQRGFTIAFITNTTSRGPTVLAEELAGMGIQVDPREIFNPTATAGSFLRAQGASAHLLVPPLAQTDFEGVAVDDTSPDYVVVGDLGDGWTYGKLNHAFRLIHNGAELIALGMSRYYRASDGLRMDVGPYIAALQFAAGVEPLVLGKPDPAFFRQILNDLVVDAGQSVMIGDDIMTDIAGGQKAGLRTVLVKTGKFEAADLEQGIKPDLILDSIIHLNDTTAI